MAEFSVFATGRRAARVHPRVILLGVVCAVAVAIPLYLVAPWILPVRVYEGPLVQMTTEDGVTLVWYTTRPAECTVEVSGAGEQRRESAEADGTRNRVELAGLRAGTTYAYEVRAGGRPLTKGLVFETARTADEPFTFLVFGDSGRGTRAQYLLAAEMVQSLPPPNLVLHTGDVVYARPDRGRYEERFFTPYRPLLARVNFWPSLGNHDLDEEGSAAIYQGVFELPENGPPGLPEERNYWFDYGAGRFAILDSNMDEAVLREQVAPWLAEVMADPMVRWRFVVLHHPPYTGGKYAPDERIQRALVPTFEATGVDVVFSGHDHNYQRSHPLRGGQVVEVGTGVVYIVTGAGGAGLYSARQPRPEFVAAIDDQRHSFTQVMIDEDLLRLRQIAVGGDLLDEVAWHKHTAAPPPLEEPAEATTVPDTPEPQSP